ncbi:MAG TPA: hypothetical protein VMW16_07545 [Sedimentisphaerales bacterium]|nr:hypothetical protein [Sedimentisphaerales bacterium]
MKCCKNHIPKCISKVITLLALCCALWSYAHGQTTVSEGALANMPVKEVTIFKDGHVFVVHEGKVPVDSQGDVVLDYLPCPVLGTFWPYSANPKVKLSAVVAGRRIVSLNRTALTVRELIQASPGAKVRIKEQNQAQPYQATILSIPSRSTEELAKTSPPGTEEMLPQQGNIVLLQTAEGVKAVPLDRIEEVTFVDEPKNAVTQKDYRNLMTLKLNWDNRKSEQTADVGMAYVQLGIRWIPSYRVEIDGTGNAVIELQATLINELTDLRDVTANLVIGVPTFAFKDQVDPISLQRTVAQLSPYFRADSRTAFALSNAIMSQSAPSRYDGAREDESGRAGIIDLGPEVTGSLRNEDLYVFTVEHITLKKGQRMVLPVSEFKLKYKDVFTLDLPFGPPPEVRHNFNNQQQAEIARFLLAPRLMHKIRLENDSKYPLTTAPALIFRKGRVIAQAMMKYTPVAGSTDLDLTIAVDITTEKTDKETGFTPDAEKWGGDRYGRRDLTGTITLTNRRTDKVYIEVVRSILGHIDTADQDGTIDHLDRMESGWMLTDGTPFWWNWYGWPHWWYYFNSVGRVTWKFELEPGKTKNLNYNWKYFWRQ